MSDLPRRELPYAWPDLRQRLQARVPELLTKLGIRERGAGGLVQPLNPRRNDRNPGSFVIWTAGDAAGGWHDYAIGAKGDVFDLIAYLGGLQTKMDAYWWALEFLGLGRGEIRTTSQAQQDRERAEADRKAAEAKADADAEGKAAKLFKYWLSLPPFTGTLADRYLVEARQIPLERLKQPPGALRFAASEQHFDPETGELTDWPCMVAAMTGGKKLAGLQRTWLQPDGLGKAPVTPAKKMFGSVKGAAIRLSSGPSGLSPTEAAKKGRADPLMIGEGIETTLTCAVAMPEYRAWAAGSLALMGGLEWPACASAVILLRDNDWKAEAVKAFERAEAHWRAQANGRPVKVAASKVGSDFNDWGRA